MNTCPQCGTEYPPTVRICTKDGTVLEETRPTDPQVGRVLDGKYRLDSRLSAGGMGTVYRGTHMMLNKTVAVKLINPELVTSQEIVKRFQREARAASNLNHPNIAPAYDLGQTDNGTLYIAMELVNGPSLKEAIRSSGQLEPARIVRIMRQVASALSLAHKNDIIHRDLKPHNIMLAKDDRGQEVPKLLDFGIAKTFDDSGTQLTATGFALGTPQYMSPEQATGQPVDGRSDLYALGIILYEMLVGEVPFNDPSTPAVLVKQMIEPPQAPSRRRPDLTISPALEAIAMRCLEKDPNARYQSADEFAAALEDTTAAHAVPDTQATVVLAPGSMPGTTPTRTAVPSPPPAPGADAFGPTLVISDVQTKTGQPAKASPPPAPTRTAAPAVPPVATAPPMPPPAPPRMPTATATPARPPAGAMVTAPPIAIPDAAGSLVPAPPAAVSVLPASKPKGGISPAIIGVVAVVLLLLVVGGVAYGVGYIKWPGSSTASPLVDANAGVPPAAPASAPSPVDTGGGAPPPVSPTPAPPIAGGTPITPPSTPAPTPAAPPPAGPPAATPAATPAPQQAPPPAPRPANPSVFFRCSGAPEICPNIRSTVERMLSEGSIPTVRDEARADIVIDARVTFLGDRTENLFGTSVTTHSYSTELTGDAPRANESVAMPEPVPLSFADRVRTERVGDHARLIGVGVVEKVREYWKKK